MAWAATRTKNTYYSARYHRLAARRGKKRALIAVGHSILKSVYRVLRTQYKYHILSGKEQYKELGADYLNSKIEAKRKNYLKAELEKLGYRVDLNPLPKAG